MSKNRAVIDYGLGDNYNQGMYLLSELADNGGDTRQNIQKANQARWAFVAAERNYRNTHGLADGQTSPMLANIGLHKAKSISKTAFFQKEKGNYIQSLEGHIYAYKILKTAEKVYIDDSVNYASYRALYDVVINLACNHKERSNCHEQLGDTHGASLAASAAIKQIEAIESGFKTYLSSKDGKIEAEMLSAMKEEVTNRIVPPLTEEELVLMDNTDHQAVLDSKDKRRHIQQLWISAIVCFPQCDWLSQVQDSKSPKKRPREGGNVPSNKKIKEIIDRDIYQGFGTRIERGRAIGDVKGRV